MNIGAIVIAAIGLLFVGIYAAPIAGLESPREISLKIPEQTSRRTTKAIVPMTARKRTSPGLAGTIERAGNSWQGLLDIMPGYVTKNQKFYQAVSKSWQDVSWNRIDRKGGPALRSES